MRVFSHARLAGWVCAALAVAGSVPAHAATIVVAAGGDFQAALNAAQPGDVITLAAGATYSGNFVLPNKGAITTAITIRSSASDAQLPAAGVRMSPAYASLLPKIKSPNSTSALRTATAANHWTLMFLEFQANYNGYGDIVALGAGDTTQTTLAQVPYALVLDRVYVHGDPVMGQKRGIALHSSDTQVLNSYIADCKAVGQDAQAIGGYNGPGNYVIQNNYLEGSTENFLLGGADPTIPNLVPSNITLRQNYLSKPVSWRDPIVATPTNVAAAATSGSLAAGTYAYKVIAQMPAGQTTTASSAASNEVTATVGASGGVKISWAAVSGATGYVVYGRASGAESLYWKTTATSYTDTGAAGTSGTPPSATMWAVKNSLELKNAQDVVAEGNVFENVWMAAQQGYPIVFTPRNQGGTAPWSVVQRITFRYNLVRHTAGGVNILGYDNLQPSLEANHITVANNVFDDMTSATWGAGSRPFEIGDGGDSITIDHNTVITTDTAIVWLYGGSATAPMQITNVAFTNNMSLHNTYGLDGDVFGTGNPSINAYWPGAVVTANVLAGGKASLYPAGNFFPTAAAWEAGFVNYAAGNYSLASTSPYKNAGMDEADLGADIATMSSETAVALSGNLAGGAPPTCSFSVSPTTASIIGAGGAATIAVTTMAGCTWTAVSHGSWLTVTSGASGSGSGNVKYTVTANSGAARSTTLTIAGKTVTINEAAAAVVTPPAPQRLRVVGE